jgi:hypothetical protein
MAFGANFWNSIAQGANNLGKAVSDADKELYNRRMQEDSIAQAADYRRQIMERQQEQDKQQRNMLGITDGEPGGYIALDRRRADQERADAKTAAEAADANWNKVLEDPSLNDEMSAYDFYNLATGYDAQLHPKAIQNYSVRSAREKAKAEAEKAAAKAAAEKQKQDDLRKYQQGQVSAANKRAANTGRGKGKDADKDVNLEAQIKSLEQNLIAADTKIREVSKRGTYDRRKGKVTFKDSADNANYNNAVKEYGEISKELRAKKTQLEGQTKLGQPAQQATNGNPNDPDNLFPEG